MRPTLKYSSVFDRVWYVGLKWSDLDMYWDIDRLFFVC